jgi:hypothetical protein
MELSNEGRSTSMVRVALGALEGLKGRVMTADANELMIAVSNSPGVYLIVESRCVEPLIPKAEVWG